MNQERNKFLTELVTGDKAKWICHECDIISQRKICDCKGAGWSRYNFSTWDGFGKLKEWAEKREWWKQFKCDVRYNGWHYALDDDLIHPDRFAEAIYEFLKEKEK
jgi:hypothetical protein